MGVKGSQDFWVVGSRFYFTRKPVITPTGTQTFPEIDMGVVREAASPTMATESRTLKDPDSGILTTVETGSSSIEETYTLKLANFALPARRMLFLADDVRDFTRTADVLDTPLTLYPEHLARVMGTDNLPILGLRAISGIYVPTNPTDRPTLRAGEVAAMDAANGWVTFQNDPATFLSVGQNVIIAGNSLENAENSRTYNVAEIAPAGAPPNSIRVTGGVRAGETGVMADLYLPNANVNILRQDVDWEVRSVDRALARIVPGGAINVQTAARCIFQQTALSGDREIIPQSTTAIEGSGIITWARQGNRGQSGRIMPLLSIQPAGSNLSADSYSDYDLTVTVIEDGTKDNKVGTVLDFKGDLPSKS